MEELLKKINKTFDNCIENSSEETQLQLRIIKNNINALFKEYSNDSDIEHSNNDVLMPTVATTSSVGVEYNSLEEKGKDTIFIIDDSSIVRNFLKKLFDDEYNILFANDGKEAIDKLSDEKFSEKVSLVLLDLMMPNIDGFGVLEYLNGKKLNIPTMIISGDNSKDTINRAFQYDVVDVIEKPFDAKKIKDKISRFINK